MATRRRYLSLCLPGGQGKHAPILSGDVARCARSLDRQSEKPGTFRVSRCWRPSACETLSFAPS